MRSEALGVSVQSVGSETSDSGMVEISRKHDSLIDSGTMIITGSDALAEGLNADKFYIKATLIKVM
ncbi:hypothetical protein KHA80_13070 [Anaerobacillus sp. HL2]|nr:hypothetical protein KHA80_13070 [Anaerobacillus sp. HL2]